MSVTKTTYTVYQTCHVYLDDMMMGDVSKLNPWSVDNSYQGKQEILVYVDYYYNFMAVGVLWISFNDISFKLTF